MNRAVRGLAAVLVVMGAVSHAGEGPYDLGDIYISDTARWRDVTAAMSPEDYRAISRQNKRVIRNTVKNYITDAFSALGVPQAGVYVTGAAVALFRKGGKLNLNADKTLYLEVDDVTSGDRTIQLKYKIEW